VDQDDYRERLAHDLAVWRNEGVISGEQEHAMLARAGAGEPRLIGALRMGWLVTAISIIGAIVLAAGVVLLFAANWEEMPDWFRTALVFVAMLAAYAAAYALMFRYDMQRVGSAFLLLGSLIFEAGIFLLAQIYNMPVESPELWLLAAAGIMPLAYLFESRIVLLVAIANAVVWVVTAIAQRYEEGANSELVMLVIGLAGMALYAIGRLHATRDWTARFADVYVFAGLLVVMALVYIFSFVEIWDEMIDSGVESYAAPPIVYLVAAIVGALVLAQAFLRERGIETLIDTGAQATLLVVTVIVATWPAWTGYMVVFNGVYFAIAAGVVARGYLRGDERYINAGLLAVGIGLLTRYVDVFWSLLANSAFFIIGGLLLLAVALIIERLRRDLIRGMSDVSEEQQPGLPPTEAPA
jgi:uncharacterized membrane protein